MRADGPSTAVSRDAKLKPIELTLRPAVFDRYVLAFNIAGVFEALTKSAQTLRIPIRRCRIEKPNRGYRLLCTRNERPRDRRAEKRDEIAPPHTSHIPPRGERCSYFRPFASASSFSS